LGNTRGREFLMKKYLGILSFLLVLPLTVISASRVHAQKLTPEQKKAQDIERAYAATALAMNETLVDPAIHYSFSQTQQTLLRTNIDLMVADFLESSPLIQMIRPMLVQKVQEDVEQGVRNNRMHMTPIHPESPNHIDQEIYETARAALRASGRTEKEIADAQIWLALGNVNAYTFSGRDGKLNIVIQSDLVDKLSYLSPEVIDGKNVNIKHVKKDFLAAVFGHENGHVKSDHVPQGLENAVMMMQVFKYFAFDGSKPGATSDDNWRRIVANLTPGSIVAKSRGEGAAASARGSLTDIANLAAATLDEVFAKNPEQIKSILNPYLDLLIKIVLKNGEMNGGVLDTLVMLRSASAVPGSIHPEKLGDVFSQVSSLISREQETSADMFAFTAVSRLFAAGVFTTFSGSDLSMTPELDERYLKEIFWAVQNIHNQADLLYKDATPEQVHAMLSGADVDHPLGPLRIENILRYGNTMDVMAMANPILRLVVTHTGLRDMVRIDEANQAFIKKKIAEIRPLVANAKSPELTAKLAEYEKLLETENLEADQLKDGANIIGRVTIKMISQLGFDGELNDNPLLADVLSYHYARKVRNLWTVDELTKALPEVTDADEKKLLEERIQFYQTRFADGDDLMKKIRSQVVKGKNKNKKVVLDLIDKSIDPKLNIEEARAQRTELFKLTGKADSLLDPRPWTPVGSEMEDVARFSSLADKHVSPKKRAEQIAKNLDILARGNYSESAPDVALRVNQGTLPASFLQACAVKLDRQLKKPLN
jgi:hypothetical protein